jgi:hypothetical protein
VTSDDFLQQIWDDCRRLTEREQCLPLIGLTGFKNSGKDSVARILVEEFGYVRRAFADNLKMEVWARSARLVGHFTGPGHGLDWPAWLAYVEQHKHEPPDSPHGWPRQLLQAWAQMRRDLSGEEYWLKQVALEPGIVVSDVRYPNERVAIKTAGGVVWRIERPGTGSDGHASEVQIATLEVDDTVYNTGSLDDLVVKVRLALGRSQEKTYAEPRART